MAKSAEQIAKRWQDAMASPQTAQRYRDGIDATTVNPMELAAQQDQFYLQQVQASVTSGKRAQRLRETPLSAWKDGAKNKGAGRLSSGAQQSAPKYRAALQKWAPIYAQVSSEVAQMPKGGLANAQARANRAIEIMMAAAGRA